MAADPDPSASHRYLVQILLPLADNEGAALPAHLFEAISRQLTQRFGGLTSYMQAPAEGRWKQGGDTATDELVVFEIMTDALDRAWWADYRRALERAFRQEEVVIRASEITRL